MRKIGGQPPGHTHPPHSSDSKLIIISLASKCRKQGIHEKRLERQTSYTFIKFVVLVEWSVRLLEGNTGRSVVVQLSLVHVLAVVPDETVRTVRLGVLRGVRVSVSCVVKRKKNDGLLNRKKSRASRGRGETYSSGGPSTPASTRRPSQSPCGETSRHGATIPTRCRGKRQ
jgi:hypothetical protein